MKLGSRACALAWLLLPGAAHAANCSITTVTAVAFGVYTPSSASANDTAGSFTYQCSNVGSLEFITIDLGKGQANSFFPRKMISLAGHTLNYNLFLASTRLLIWGDGTSGTIHLGPVLLTTAAVPVFVFGRIPALQSVIPGEYSDTVVITANF